MATGTDLDIFEKKLKELTAETRVNNLIFSDTDFEEIRNYVNEYDINIMIGNSDGAFIEEKDGVPLIRVGFPIHDRVGASRQQNIGYQGSNNFLDQITNQLLALKHNNYRKDLYKEYYQSNNDKKTSQKPEELKVGEK
jgi:nitrogenase molybdenum-iron protein NifN